MLPRAGVESLEPRALLATTATGSLPLLPPDLGGPTATLADTIALPALTATALSGPGSPTGLVAVPGDARVSLTWSAPLSSGGAKISDYVIEHSADAGTTWTRFVDRVSATTAATVTGLANGTSYSFRVAAVNAAGTGAFSIASSAVAPRRLSGAPTSLVGTPGDQRVTLSWNPPASDGGAAITDYVVRISGDGGKNWTTVADGVSPATSITVTGLTNGARYVFRVAAVNAAGTGTSVAQSASLTPRTLPQAPTGVAAVPGDGRVSLTWSAPLSSGGAKISDYVIEHRADAGTTWTRVVDPVSPATSATVTGLANGTSYLFRVAAVNAAGAGAPSIASPAVAPRRLPGAPTGLVATPGDQRVSLSWNAPVSDGGAAITDYVVRISGDAGATWTTVTDGVSPATSATVTGLTNGARYVYRVSAVNAAGTGDPANDSPTFIPATFGGFSEYSAPTQIVTGSAGLLSGRVADPAGDRVDAIHVYRDLDGNGVLDPGSDGLLLADTTAADGYAFDAGSLPSGRHVLYVAAMKDGAVAGSITTTLVAARWWSVSIGSLTDGESRLPTTGALVADPAPIELAPGPGGGPGAVGMPRQPRA
jgi:titin